MGEDSWVDEDQAIIDACEPTEDYESESGIKLFFERLRAGWFVDRAGRMRPPKLPNLADHFGRTKQP